MISEFSGIIFLVAVCSTAFPVPVLAQPLNPNVLLRSADDPPTRYNRSNSSLTTLRRTLALTKGSAELRSGALRDKFLADPAGFSSLLIVVPVRGLSAATYTAFANGLALRVKAPRQSVAICDTPTDAEACCFDQPEYGCAYEQARQMLWSAASPWATAIAQTSAWALLRELVSMEWQTDSQVPDNTETVIRLSNDTAYLALAPEGMGAVSPILMRADADRLQVALSALIEFMRGMPLVQANERFAKPLLCGPEGASLEPAPNKLAWLRWHESPGLRYFRTEIAPLGLAVAEAKGKLWLDMKKPDQLDGLPLVSTQLPAVGLAAAACLGLSGHEEVLQTLLAEDTVSRLLFLLIYGIAQVSFNATP